MAFKYTWNCGQKSIMCIFRGAVAIKIGNLRFGLPCKKSFYPSLLKRWRQIKSIPRMWMSSWHLSFIRKHVYLKLYRMLKTISFHFVLCWFNAINRVFKFNFLNMKTFTTLMFVRNHVWHCSSNGSACLGLRLVCSKLLFWNKRYILT